ncbi:MAG: hypothetical protein U1F57_04960 [bacterium]
MKKVFKLFLCLIGLAFLFLSIWSAVNLWPRKMEPALWTEADLNLPEEKDKNGYHFLMALKDDPEWKEINNLDLPESLEPLYILSFPASESEVAHYWDEARKLAAPLSAFVHEKEKALQKYQTLLDFPQFVNQDPISDSKPKAPWLFFMESHRAGLLFMADRVVSGDVKTADETWLKMFQQDQSAVRSARNFISYFTALKNLKDDLTELAYLRAFPAPLDLQGKIEQALHDFDPEKIEVRRALISEYVFQLNFSDTISQASLKGKERGYQMIFNRALFMRDTNDFFRRLEALTKDPKAITDLTEKNFEQEIQDLDRGHFWWFYNPLGKLLRKLMTISPVHYIREFYEQKEAVTKLKTQLLALTPLFPPPPPETAPAESQSAESRPEGAETKHAPESHPAVPSAENPSPLPP